MTRRQFRKRSKTTGIALDGDNSRRPFIQQRSRQPSGTGTDLDGRAGIERPAGAGDAPGQIEVEDKVLSEAPTRGDAVADNDLPQRRQCG